MKTKVTVHYLNKTISRLVKPKIVKAYCIVDENGTLLLDSLRKSKKECSIFSVYGTPVKIEIKAVK